MADWTDQVIRAILVGSKIEFGVDNNAATSIEVKNA
jgi:hypothetical protein